MKSPKLTIVSQIDFSSKKTWATSIEKLARIAIFGSNVNPAITFRMKGLLSKAEFETWKAQYELLAQREAKRLCKKYPFVALSATAVAA